MSEIDDIRNGFEQAYKNLQAVFAGLEEYYPSEKGEEMSGDKTIEAIKSDIRTVEESVAKLLSMLTEQYGVVIERIDVDSGPAVWDMEGERVPQYDYRVKFKTTL